MAQDWKNTPVPPPPPPVGNRPWEIAATGTDPSDPAPWTDPTLTANRPKGSDPDSGTPYGAPGTRGEVKHCWACLNLQELASIGGPKGGDWDQTIERLCKDCTGNCDHCDSGLCAQTLEKRHGSMLSLTDDDG